jgi:molecular chaperone GrpE
MKKQDQHFKKLEEDLKKLDELRLRALADYQNLERRTEEEKKDFAQYANSELILKILPGLDSLEKAQIHLKDPGLDLAIKQLSDGLKEAGVAEVETLGVEFNPRDMECLELVEGEEGFVIDEARKGYKLGDKVIRTALVRVGIKGKGETK